MDKIHTAIKAVNDQYGVNPDLYEVKITNDTIIVKTSFLYSNIIAILREHGYTLYLVAHNNGRGINCYFIPTEQIESASTNGAIKSSQPGLAAALKQRGF